MSTGPVSAQASVPTEAAVNTHPCFGILSRGEVAGSRTYDCSHFWPPY